jgi:hypothetical protein
MLVRSFIIICTSIAVFSCSEGNFSAKKLETQQDNQNLTSQSNNDVNESIAWGYPCHITQQSQVAYDTGFKTLIYCSGNKWEKVPASQLDKMGSINNSKPSYKLVETPYKPVTTENSDSARKDKVSSNKKTKELVSPAKPSGNSFRCRTVGPEKSFRCRKSVGSSQNLAH